MNKKKSIKLLEMLTLSLAVILLLTINAIYALSTFEKDENDDIWRKMIIYDRYDGTTANIQEKITTENLLAEKTALERRITEIDNAINEINGL